MLSETVPKNVLINWPITGINVLLPLSLSTESDWYSYTDLNVSVYFITKLPLHMLGMSEIM